MNIVNKSVLHIDNNDPYFKYECKPTAVVINSKDNPTSFDEGIILIPRIASSCEDDKDANISAALETAQGIFSEHEDVVLVLLSWNNGDYGILVTPA